MKNSFYPYINRRFFMLQAIAASGVSCVATATHAAFLEENNYQALALGYKEDVSRIDKIRYPKYTVGQRCGNCALFKGSVGSAEGSCPLFASKQVRAYSWCSAYAPDAARGGISSQKPSVLTPNDAPPENKNSLESPAFQQKQSGFDEAKAKCADLGFEIGTEKFGNCVLKLTK
jgi:High potential iron-sulfur protein